MMFDWKELYCFCLVEGYKVRTYEYRSVVDLVVVTPNKYERALYCWEK